jgi:hypothetical protein
MRRRIQDDLVDVWQVIGGRETFGRGSVPEQKHQLCRRHVKVTWVHGSSGCSASVVRHVDLAHEPSFQSFDCGISRQHEYYTRRVPKASRKVKSPTLSTTLSIQCATNARSFILTTLSMRCESNQPRSFVKVLVPEMISREKEKRHPSTLALRCGLEQAAIAHHLLMADDL